MIKHGPCDMSLINKTWPEWTICEVLRKLYRMTDDPEAQILIRIAVTMAKAMSSRLQFYKNDWQDGFWEQNRNITFRKERENERHT